MKDIEDVDEDALIGEPLDAAPQVAPDEKCRGRKKQKRNGEVVRDDDDNALFGGYCKSWAGSGTDDDEGRCKFHGGNNSGENGQGGTENNGNAAKHNLRADRGKLYHRLSDKRQQKVDDLEDALIDRYEEFHGREPDRADVEDLFELAMGYVQRDYARDWMVENPEAGDNPAVETIMTDNGPIQVPARIHEMMMDSRREDRLMKKDMGLFRDPETKKAESVATLSEIVDDE